MWSQHYVRIKRLSPGNLTLTGREVRHLERRLAIRKWLSPDLRIDKVFGRTCEAVTAGEVVGKVHRIATPEFDPARGNRAVRLLGAPSVSDIR